MAETNKHRTIRERIAAENEYQRAAAEWVAKRTGYPADLIEGVDFGFETDYRLSTLTWQPGQGSQLVYKRNGKDEAVALEPTTPGQFVEECVAILEAARDERAMRQ